MKMMKNLLGLALMCIGISSRAQDPHFSQFFMAPHFINPANVGTQYGDWTAMGNFRQQWNNAGTLFLTQSLAAEAKILGLDDEMNTLAIGLSFLNDQNMNGSFVSNYASGTLAYHVQLANNHRIGIGFQGSYSKRNLNFSNLSFGQQFTGRGFDLFLPNGEPNLFAMPAFFSMGAGLMYTFSTYNFNVDVGAAMYDINRPYQSFQNQENRLEPRYALKLNAEYITNGSVIINLHNMYQRQNYQNYYALGGTMGLAVSSGTWDKILYAGGWFREGDSFIPYTGIQINDIRIGLSYDFTYSKQNKGPFNPQSFELSIMFTKSRKTNIIPDCRVPARFQRNNIRLN